MHWDGIQWSVEEFPSVAAEVHLQAIAALASTDAWAVGSYVDPTGSRLTLILHWDGSVWSQVDSPSPDGAWNQLWGVAAISATDAWAVGSAGDSALALHWDGQGWMPADLPDLGRKYSILDAVGGSSESDVWAVGEYQGCNQLILHWDGQDWTKDPYSNGVGGRCFDAHSELDVVSVLSATDVWASGGTGCCGGDDPNIVHWNGEQWVGVPFDADLGGLDSIGGIAAISANDAWAVGTTGDGFSDFKMLIMHWDGTAWTQQESPTPLKYGAGIVGLSDSDAWISGEVFLHWTGE